jgi:hypothetical protein
VRPKRFEDVWGPRSVDEREFTVEKGPFLEDGTWSAFKEWRIKAKAKRQRDSLGELGPIVPLNARDAAIYRCLRSQRRGGRNPV